jgi:Ca2+-binding EF-hand superfamily protein
MRVRHAIATLAAFLAAQVGPAFAQPLNKNTEHMVDASIQKLLRQMDRDKNGTVSKDEFLRHFSERFDRLDVNRDRRLESEELLPMLIPNGKKKKSPPNGFYHF